MAYTDLGYLKSETQTITGGPGPTPDAFFFDADEYGDVDLADWGNLQDCLGTYDDLRPTTPEHPTAG
jgi:hypothetical protein